MIPNVTANGADIPAIGFGTWPMKGREARNAVIAALDAGYRHIDTAAMYGNEAEVGEAIRGHGASREAIFVTTKVWPSDIAAGRLAGSAEASVKRLGIDRPDLLLIHWPAPGMPIAKQVEALCEAHRRGLARHIGISNFSPEQVEQAVRAADVPLVTNQIEHFPGMDQSATLAACARHRIAVTSYSPLGKGRLLRDPAIDGLARAKGKTAAQIVLRWHLQQPNNIAIPKSSDTKRIKQNIDIFDFELSEEEMRRISSIG